MGEALFEHIFSTFDTSPLKKSVAFDLSATTANDYELTDFEPEFRSKTAPIPSLFERDSMPSKGAK